MVAGGAGARHPGHLVGLHAGPAVLPGLVAAAPRLAGRRRPARRPGRLGPLVPPGHQDQVLLLRPGIRALPHPGHRLVPGPDPRPGLGGSAAPVGRRGHRGRVRPGRPHHVLVLLPAPGRPDHLLPGLVEPHLVPGGERLGLRRRLTCSLALWLGIQSVPSHATPLRLPASPAGASTGAGLTWPPRAFRLSLRPRASTLRAAFTSRSWTVPHAAQVQTRTLSGLGPSLT